MNLTITPNFKLFNYQQAQQLRAKNIKDTNTSSEKADAISFTARKMPDHIFSPFSNAVEQSYLSQLGKFVDSAKEFHGALARVCAKLEDFGFVYDKTYNSKHPVKSQLSYIDKFERQGYVQDAVRGTVYWLNQQDIGAFKKFIEAMKEEGFEIATFKRFNKDTKKFVKVPDLEIRQSGIEKKDLEILGPFLSKAEISKPRTTSRYSDYQMRFVNSHKRGKSENKQPLELIILYGPHYSKAKEAESKYVYDIVRLLEKVHINLDINYPERSPARRIVNNIDVIKTRLREDISKPLFLNAYISDAKLRGEEKLPVVVSKVHAKMLDGYMSGVRQKIPLHYKEMRQKAKSDEFISKLIANTVDYKERENKNITPEEIKAFRESYLDKLMVLEAEDIAIVAKAQDMLKETLDKYIEKEV